jgi:guanine deaminase
VTDESFMRRAIALSRKSLDVGEGGPFGAVVVRDGEIIGEGWNQVLGSRDPTAHAEIVAIRAACSLLGRHNLDGADIYTTCEPCPMCLGAILWARIGRLFYANTRADAAAIGFDDAEFYAQVAAPLDQRTTACVRLLANEAHSVFLEWRSRADRVLY